MVKDKLPTKLPVQNESNGGPARVATEASREVRDDCHIREVGDDWGDGSVHKT